MYSTVLACALALAPSPPSSNQTVLDDYARAYHAARAADKMLLVDVGTGFDFSRLDEKSLGSFVVCQVSAEAALPVEGHDRRLLDYPGLSDLEGKPGLIIVEFDHAGRDATVVSVLPARHVSDKHVRALLDLPAGTLTQRTLVWALRVHPERPRSVSGTPAPELVAHAERHSGVQAATNNQHHDMPLGISKSEIVAESWEWNKNVVDAAIDIVHSWRQSSGHWSAARRAWSYYGYDMKSNGVKWFATGVFR